MRLIDAEALIKDLRLMAKYQDPYKCSTILGVCSTIEAKKTIDAEPVLHGRCDICDIKETGHGAIGFYGNGWQVCIRRHGTAYEMVVNHCGDQIAVPIAFCPECGVRLEAEHGKAD